MGSPEAELSILLVGDEEIAALNRTYLNREGPTNVIAFPMQEGEFSDISPRLLGDVVISVDTAHKEAAAAGMPIGQRVAELLVHGVLHLFGYDHEAADSDAASMERRSRSLLQLLETSDADARRQEP